MSKNKKKTEEDMSQTFIAEVGQKSAIADDKLDDIEFTKDKEEKIDKEEKNSNNEVVSYDEEKKSGSTAVLVVIVTIISLIIGVAGGYYFFKLTDKKETVNTTKKEEVNAKTEEELNPEGIFINNLIENYDLYPDVDVTNLYNLLYSQEKLEVKSLSEHYMMNLAAKKTVKFLGTMEFSGEDFQKSVTELFGPNVTIENKNFTDTGDDKGGCYKYEYRKEDDYYILPKASECGYDSTISLERKIINAIKSKDNIEVNVAVAVVDNEEDKVYKNYSENKEELEEVDNVVATTFDIDKDYTELNQYKYTFNYDKENNNYYLVSIELDK